MEDHERVKAILEKALFDLQDMPESRSNKSARADLWYALGNLRMLKKEVANERQADPR